MAAEARPGGARTRASAPLWRACTLFSPDRTLARHCEELNSVLELYIMDTPICARQIPPFIGFVLYFSRVVVRLLEKWTNKAKWREGGDLAGSTISVFNDPAGSPAERRSASEDSSYPRYSTAAAGDWADRLPLGSCFQSSGQV